jgi:hypothetical protein
MFDDRGDERATRRKVPHVAKLGNVDDLVEMARQTRIDLVIVSLPITAEARNPGNAQEALGAASRHPARRTQ